MGDMPTDLVFAPALSRPDLLADPVAAALSAHDLPDPVEVAAIDADLADTAAFCATYRVGLDESANCVVVAGRRGQVIRFAACVVLATTRVDVNGVVRRWLDVRKVSFASREDAVGATAMEFGGITPIGLPTDWPVLVDAAVLTAPRVIIGSGLRRSKLSLPGKALAAVPDVEVIENLGLPA
jgi:prolyl-tRNA editing enzyme YbaK/EbsC (Cys-tRNA(Pro) deacylase)